MTRNQKWLKGLTGGKAVEKEFPPSEWDKITKDAQQ